MRDPVGATFDQVYNGSLNYVLWSDQFYGDPVINAKGCSKGPKGGCASPWGHSKGMVAWENAGNGAFMQVTTPSWPASGSKAHPRKQASGNTLGCIRTNNILVSQHFFAVRPNKSDLAQVLRALKRAEAVLQERLINWGYAVCDAGMRRHVDATIQAPKGFPVPRARRIGHGHKTSLWLFQSEHPGYSEFHDKELGDVVSWPLDKYNERVRVNNIAFLWLAGSTGGLTGWGTVSKLNTPRMGLLQCVRKRTGFMR